MKDSIRNKENLWNGSEGFNNELRVQQGSISIPYLFFLCIVDNYDGYTGWGGVRCLRIISHK